MNLLDVFKMAHFSNDFSQKNSFQMDYKKVSEQTLIFTFERCDH